MEDEFLTVLEASRKAGVHTVSVYRWLANGTLTKYRVGKRGVRVSARELDRLMQPTAAVS